MNPVDSRFLFLYIMNYNIAIIVAGGVGSRIKSDIPKQFLNLKDRPVLMHTVKAFEDTADKIVLILHPEMKNYWIDLCDQYGFDVSHEVVEGGDSRFKSVKNGLLFIENNYPQYTSHETAIAVHDGARPLISTSLIRQSYELCHRGHANALATQSINSIRIGSSDDSQSYDRSKIWQMQTPQTFPADRFIQSYLAFDNDLNFTDDCSVWERYGQKIKLIEGSHRNIKITYPEDLAFAEVISDNLSA